MKASKVGRLIERGKARYILIYGVLGWGLFTGTFMAVYFGYTDGEFTWRSVIARYVCLCLVGIWFGSSMWKRIVKNYELKHQNETDDIPDFNK